MLKRVVHSLILAASVFLGHPSFAGDGFRGGGDIVTCTKSASNDFVGTYPLGLLQNLMIKKKQLPRLLANQSATCKKVTDDLTTSLTQHFPVLSAGFQSYMSSFNHAKKPLVLRKLHREWIKCDGKSCLNNLKDEGLGGHLVFELPENCQKITQYALRKKKENNGHLYITYYLNETAHKSLAGPNCAFNLVHEWLRDSITDPDDLYQASFLIFSDNLEAQRMSKSGLFQFLPDSLLIGEPISSGEALDIYVQFLTEETQEFCTSPKSKIICSLKFFQYNDSFGVLTKISDNKIEGFIPYQKGKDKIVKLKKGSVTIIDYKDVKSGFLVFLESYSIEKLRSLRIK